ncbi:MAG: ABC transporter ATP-binding protein [Acidiferrobacterales bacterium]|nr:ABC transporter ATP-binding protein [Acidiferrobacterales bacterium]
MIELQALSMRYPLERDTVTVLQAIDLSIDRGESVAVVGPSGSGKTTLLLLLAGLEQASDGVILIDGVRLSDLDVDAMADLRRDRLGIIFQSFHLIPSLSALGNVALPLEIAGKSDARQQAREMLEKVDLGHRVQHYPTQLSGGEQQRVAIARALVHSPALLIADEPTGNLDQHTGDKVGDLLFNLHTDVGATLIMATHDQEMARRCDRILQMENGSLVEQRHNAVSA